MMRNDLAEILFLSDTRYRDPYREGYDRLRDGKAPWSCRGEGGTWYFKGDKQEAIRLADAVDEISAARRESYYSQLWV